MVDARAEAFTSPRILLDPMMRMLSFWPARIRWGSSRSSELVSDSKSVTSQTTHSTLHISQITCSSVDCAFNSVYQELDSFVQTVWQQKTIEASTCDNQNHFIGVGQATKELESRKGLRRVQLR
jgi:hypothetical protein